MRAVVQRVTRAKVTSDDGSSGEIQKGLVVLVGVAHEDTAADAEYLAEKIAALRIFADDRKKMNLSVRDVNGSLLIISQFTLFGDVRRGLRPSWSEAAAPDLAGALYEHFVNHSRKLVSNVATGSFRCMMQVELVNDGPVTILLDTEKRF